MNRIASCVATDCSFWRPVLTAIELFAVEVRRVKNAQQPLRGIERIRTRLIHRQGNAGRGFLFLLLLVSRAQALPWRSRSAMSNLVSAEPLLNFLTQVRFSMTGANGKTALITGSTDGVGRMVAERLGQDRWRVLVHAVAG
jgi:hypothetical protein